MPVEESHTRRGLTPPRLQRLALARDHRQRSARVGPDSHLHQRGHLNSKLHKKCTELAAGACKQTSGSSCVVIRKSWTQSPENTMFNISELLLAAAQAHARLNRMRVAHSLLRASPKPAPAPSLSPAGRGSFFCTGTRSEPAVPGRIFRRNIWQPCMTQRWPGSRGSEPAGTRRVRVSGLKRPLTKQPHAYLFLCDLSQRDLFQPQVSDRQDMFTTVLEGRLALVRTDPLCQADEARVFLYFQVCQSRQLTARCAPSLQQQPSFSFVCECSAVLKA